MRCSSPNCECNKCSGCNRNYCICNLIDETESFLNELEYEDETRARVAEHLLKDWLNATKA